MPGSSTARVLGSLGAMSKDIVLPSRWLLLDKTSVLDSH